ncbi:DNA (cytosine-5-)-methyltransferase [uncultured Winogradskyella sp.]|uniref:DNA cytosine methyltransferase n=1 Tax=uncultured Winogradskyella sp. TaxID=395353 RepID=UPI00260929AD|nr:DNA (cytosine-5-)-methyltransferase [uncultured Winogradskyella sp.]
MNLTNGSLFSGAGGFELGAEWNGIETIWNCEIIEERRKLLKLRFPKAKQYEDIIQLREPEYADIICGGFPCQDISIAQQTNGGAKGIKGNRSGLWSEMYRICGLLRPKYILAENSSMLVNRGLEQVLCDLSKIGYDAEWRCLRGFDFGLPDKRERIYIIAYPKQERWTRNNEITRCFREILPKRSPGQIALSMPIKRFQRRENLSGIRMDNEFSKELDKNRIEAMGNAVKPIIASYLYKCIIEHYRSQLV